MSMKENIEEIRRQIGHHAEKADPSGGDVLLIAVTKTRTPEEIEEAIAFGITDIGENKVQELLDKYDQVTSKVRWHMIGHLQRNKVRQIIDKVYMIHSVDSFRLAQEIDRRAGVAGLTARILIQVNAAGEQSKFGVAPEEAQALIERILDECEHISIRGLMHMAPLVDDPEEVRHYFTEVRQLYDRLGALRHPRLDLNVLSMGMSGDFGVAIEEGANAVRIGTSIFGGRDYQ